MRTADLHCDLLSYLLEPGRSPENPESRASIGQMKHGQVALQVLAAFTITGPESAQLGERQVEIYRQLSSQYAATPETFRVVLAIENASSFCEETEPLAQALERLERWQNEAGPIAYISLTWNDENRFGGGNESTAGLKPDGETLLQWMSGKGIAIDLSHTSDLLAEEIFNTIDRHRIKIGVIASHSNFRAIVDHPRNLPDPIALEIIQRKGLIGLNFVRAFLGSEPDAFLRHIEHAQKLGGMNSLCFGADFFYDGDSPPELDYLKPFYLNHFDNSSCYPRLLELLHGKLSKHQMEKLFHQNIFRFLNAYTARD